MDDREKHFEEIGVEIDRAKEELAEYTQRADELRDGGINVVALSVDRNNMGNAEEFLNDIRRGIDQLQSAASVSPSRD